MKGKKIIAIDPCAMDDGRETLTIGKEYVIVEELAYTFIIIDDEEEEHHFHKEIFDLFFVYANQRHLIHRYNEIRKGNESTRFINFPENISPENYEVHGYFSATRHVVTKDLKKENFDTISFLNDMEKGIIHCIGYRELESKTSVLTLKLIK